VAKKEKDASAASQRIKDAERMVQQRQAQRAKGGKKPFAIGKFIKDFRGDIKKIIWPDFKTVVKNTGIVLLVVAVVGVAVYAIDRGMLFVLGQLYNLAEKVNPTPEVTVPSTTAPLGLLMPWSFRF